MVWGTFQFAGVKVSEEVETVPSAMLEEEIGTVTLAGGRESRTMVNVAAPAASVVVRPAVGVTVMPMLSSSKFVAETSAALRPLYFGSALVAGAVMME